jgi:hypothetical protein
MTPPKIKISAYKAWINKEGIAKPGCRPYDTDFYTEMDAIKSGAYRDTIEKLRSIADDKERKAYKAGNLTSLSISAICKDWRNSENIVSHTGLLTIDIDHTPNPHITDWPGVRDMIFGYPNVVATFLSASFKGVAFVVRINPEQHKDVFFSLVDGLKREMGLQADVGLHDVIRLRFVSYDPDARIRYDFDKIPFARPSSHYLQNKASDASDETIEPIGEVDSEYNFLQAVKKAELRYVFKEGHKWPFLVSVAGGCNTMGMKLSFVESMVLQHYRDKTPISDEELLKPVRDVYKTYIGKHATFNVEAKYERLNKDLKRFIIKEFLHKGVKPEAQDKIQLCEQFEANPERVEYVITRVFSEFENEFGYDKMPPVNKVQIWLEKRWRFRFNKVTCQPEVSQLGTTAVSTVNPDEIFRQLQCSSFKYSLNNVKSLMRSEFVKPYDPILEYFKSLQWDGADNIGKLSSYVLTEEGEFWGDMFKKSLVRCIACGLGKKENRIVMVLYGRKEETGKSTFIRFLSPFPHRQYFTESPIIGGNQKDTEIRFSENFIYNMEELAGLSRVDVNKLKADISKASIKERRAYAAFETSAPRRCNFWASTNQKEFLHDEGNTRWLIFEVVSINWNYKSEVNVHQVWAQAWHLYNNGFDAELSAQDRAMREHLNDEYRYRRPEEELIARYFKPAEQGKGQFFSSTEIAMKLNGLSNSLKINANNIGKTMQAIYNLESRFEKINGKSTRGYWLYYSFTEAEGETPRAPFSFPTSDGW